MSIATAQTDDSVTFNLSANSTVAVTNTVPRLRITRSNGLPVQDFWYVIQGPNNFSMEVCLPAGSSGVYVTGIAPGAYTITEKSNWSWRYADGGTESVTINAANTTPTVYFHGAVSNSNYLNGIDRRLNLFKEPEE